MTDFQELDNRIQHWSLVLPPLALVPVTHYDILRGLLTVKTMCCCATILVHSSRGQGGETPLNDRVAAAALEAAALLREVNLSALQFVDSVVGVSVSRSSQMSRLTARDRSYGALWAKH